MDMPTATKVALATRRRKSLPPLLASEALAKEAPTPPPCRLILSKVGRYGTVHPKLGDRLEPDDFDGLAGVCILRARIYLAETGVARVVGPMRSQFILHAPAATGLANLLLAAETSRPSAERHRHKLALALGLADYPALWAAQKAKGLDHHHRAVREVIGWGAA